MLFKTHRWLIAAVLAFLFLFNGVALKAEMVPTPGIEPSGDLPILYVNTVDSMPVDQKEVYIQAVGWLDASTSGRCESVGSAEKPLDLGIRGRGNASWLLDGPKPYKIKFDKKQSFFDRTKNKHWALLPVSFNEMLNNFIGLELGKRLGMPFLPQRFMVDVVLNGQFVGMYMLTETIRIDEGRVEIFEQEDLNEDPTLIPYGWLVEIDNYYDPYQISVIVPDGSGRIMRITHHAPEEVSTPQKQWLTSQFRAILDAVHNPDNLDRKWEEYFDINAFTRHYLVQEIMNNWDAYIGSCYLYKDMDEQWHFGPLWDLGWSLDREKEALIAEMPDGRYQNIISQLIRFPRFRKAVSNQLTQYVEGNDSQWVPELIDNILAEYDIALRTQKALWPKWNITGTSAHTKEDIAHIFAHNVNYLVNRFSSDLFVYSVNLNVSKERTQEIDMLEDDDETDGIVLIDGLKRDSIDVNAGQSITLDFVTKYNRQLSSLAVNGRDMLPLVVDNKIVIDSISGDLEIEVSFGPIQYIPVKEIILSAEELTVEEGKTKLLTAEITPFYATDNNIQWESSDEEIVKVDEQGLVTAVTVGQTTVTATCGNVKASCAVTVIERVIPPIDYGDDEATVKTRRYLNVDNTLDLTLLTDSLDVAYWTNSAPHVVEVDSLGIARSTGFGETVIRAKDIDDKTIALIDLFVCPSIIVEHGVGIVYAHHVIYNSYPTIHLSEAAGYKIVGLTIGGEIINDEQISADGYYTFEKPVTDDIVVNVSIERDGNDGESSGNEDIVISDSPIRLYVNGHTLRVVGAKQGAVLTLTSIGGVTVFNQVADMVEYIESGIYFVTIEGESRIFKILIR